VAPRLVFAGRLVPEKGLGLLIDSLPALLERAPAATLTVAGDGPLRRDLETRVRGLGLESCVTFVGEQQPHEVTALIDGAMAVVVPSRVEGFGLVALEAALRGRPVVATRAGGLPEVVRDGATGLLVAPGDAGALASAVARLIGDPALAARLGAAARVHARATFDWDRHVGLYEELYARVAARTVGAR
jgi:glycosyltransferase involved in cell wall biosynthesis